MEHRQLINNIVTLIKKNEKSKLAISGPWGSGKTTILENVCAQLEQEYKIIKIELWNYEIYENDVFSNIMFDIMLGFDFKNTDFKDILVNSVTSVYNLTKLFVKKELINTIDTIYDSIKNIRNTLIYNKLSDKQKGQFNSKLQIDYLVKLLEESFKKYTSKKDNKKNIIIFLDDLERCSEENIIKILTGIKNVLFKCDSDNLNLNFITAINRIQIHNILGYKDEEYIEKIFEKIIDIEDITSFSDDVFVNKFVISLDELELKIFSRFYNRNYRYLEKYIDVKLMLVNSEISPYFAFWLFLLKVNNREKYRKIKNSIINNNDKVNFFLKKYTSNHTRDFYWENEKLFNTESVSLEYWQKNNRLASNHYKLNIIYNGHYKAVPLDNFTPFLDIYEEKNYSFTGRALLEESILDQYSIYFNLIDSDEILDKDFFDFLLILMEYQNFIDKKIHLYIADMNLPYIIMLLELY